MCDGMPEARNKVREGEIMEVEVKARVEDLEESKKKLVNLLSADPLGDPLIDECLDRIRSAKRRASAGSWLTISTAQPRCWRTSSILR